jgi:ATPase subunit of ABC transporter with duplicated ATPase domains
MEVVLGALPSLLPKLGELLADEYNLQKEVNISKTPPGQLPSGDKIWASNVRELSYDIEDNIDTFMVHDKGHQPAKKQSFKKFIDKTLGSLMQPKICRKIAIDIRDIKSHVVEVHDRRRRYEISHSVPKPVKVDPLALVAMVHYKNPMELVGIEESRDEVIKIMIEGNEASKEQKKIVSIVGFRGLGKTTLANVVYEKLKSQFDCSAFVSVS